uniref:Uncharacterized protein n=1 Tax=Syphacia muris TaxID=451379 RepID=A0A0N5AXL5_9BILA
MYFNVIRKKNLQKSQILMLVGLQKEALKESASTVTDGTIAVVVDSSDSTVDYDGCDDDNDNDDGDIRVPTSV